MKYLVSIPAYILSVLVYLPVVVFAQTPAVGGGGGTPAAGEGGGTPARGGGAPVSLMNPLGEGTTLIGLFNSILDVLLIFAVPIIVFFIIYAGFQYVMARGNSEAIGNAHRALLYAIIGGVLILGAKVLLVVIGGTIDALRI